MMAEPNIAVLTVAISGQLCMKCVVVSSSVLQYSHMGVLLIPMVRMCLFRHIR